MTQKTFVLCADDFGLSPAVSAGILEAIDAGRLSATGCMTNLPSFRPAAGALAARRGRVQAGVHLTLTAGAPLAPCPRLAPEGRLPALPVLLRAGRGDAELRRDIGAEIGRQLDAFAEAFGGAPDFVDGHQHVHALPLVRGALFAELERRGWTGGPWLRDSGDALTRILRRGSSVKKALAVAALTRGFGAEARRRGFATNEGFAGFSPFDPARDYGADFARYLAAPGPRHLVMCHPGRVDEALAALDPVTTTREQELAFLLSDRFAETLARAGLRATRSWDG